MATANVAVARFNPVSSARRVNDGAGTCVQQVPCPRTPHGDPSGMPAALGHESAPIRLLSIRFTNPA